MALTDVPITDIGYSPVAPGTTGVDAQMRALVSPMICYGVINAGAGACTVTVHNTSQEINRGGGNQPLSIGAVGTMTIPNDAAMRYFTLPRGLMGRTCVLEFSQIVSVNVGGMRIPSWAKKLNSPASGYVTGEAITRYGYPVWPLAATKVKLSAIAGVDHKSRPGRWPIWQAYQATGGDVTLTFAPKEAWAGADYDFGPDYGSVALSGWDVVVPSGGGGYAFCVPPGYVGGDPFPAGSATFEGKYNIATTGTCYIARIDLVDNVGPHDTVP